MFHKYFLVPALVLTAGLFLGDESAMARPGGGGGGRSSGGRSGAVSRGSGYSRGASSYGRGGYGYGRGGYGYGRGGYGGYWGGYGWWPGYGGYYGGYWPDYYDGPNYYYGPSGYTDYGPAVPYANPAPVPVSTAADIRVIVPDPAARVWFDGALTRQTGTDRLFHSAPLTTAGTYHIKAAWMENGREVTQERDVAVSPGQAVMVDFAHSPVSTPH